MIFAAGLGTRLKPLTETIPKALVKVNGKPLLQHNIEKAISAGVTEIVINVHHLANRIISFIEENNSFGIKIHISNETDELLDTGGGLKKASGLLMGNESVLLQNADILSGIDYGKMLEFHHTNKSLATLAVRDRSTSRYLLTSNNILKGWTNDSSGDILPKGLISDGLNKYAFSGIHILSPEILNYIPEQKKFNIIQWYVELAQRETISCYNHNQTYWFDIGTIEKLEVAEAYFH